MTDRIDPTTPPGTWVVCCHHEEVVEVLTEPAGNRSAYIDTAKPEHERAIRHSAFRVLRSWQSLPQPFLDAQRAYVDTGRAYGDAGRAYDDAWRAFDDAWGVYEDARRACEDAERAHLPAILAVVRAEHPDLPVDCRTGHLIFPEPPKAAQEVAP